MSSFMVGADCEVFVKNNSGYKSVIGLIGGSKVEPRKTKNGFVQEDNVLAEFNVNPASNREDFVTNTKLVLQDLNEIIKPLNLEMDIRASAHFDMNELMHPLAQLAGCEPDYDAWALAVNNKPDLSGSTLRSAGGHVHISWDKVNESPEVRYNLIRVLDLVAGVPAVILDTDTERRSLYGKAGCFRPKFVQSDHPYDGVEYRTLSSFWLKSDELIGWVFDKVETAISNFDSLLEIANHEAQGIQEAINNSNPAIAERLMAQYGV